MIPKGDRLLTEEASTYHLPFDANRRAVSDVARKSNASPASPRAPVVKNQKSVRRLSDYLTRDKDAKPPTIGSKKDLWLVHFSDVVLRCQRTGLTQPTRSNVRAKRAGPLAAQRNLYTFVRVERWEMPPPPVTSGTVAMEAIHRQRRTELSDGDVTETEEEDEPASPPDEVESRMSCVSLRRIRSASS
jgi:hypothetical protein